MKRGSVLRWWDDDCEWKALVLRAAIAGRWWWSATGVGRSLRRPFPATWVRDHWGGLWCTWIRHGLLTLTYFFTRKQINFGIDCFTSTIKMLSHEPSSKARAAGNWFLTLSMRDTGARHKYPKMTSQSILKRRKKKTGCRRRESTSRPPWRGCHGNLSSPI